MNPRLQLGERGIHQQISRSMIGFMESVVWRIHRGRERAQDQHPAPTGEGTGGLQEAEGDAGHCPP